MKKRWKLVEAAPASFIGEAPLPVVGQILWNRGLRSTAEVQAFLQPSWKDHAHDANQFRHMKAAVDRVFSALDSDQRITVHGDYDADGVTGSTVIITTLRFIESRLGARIPERGTSTQPGEVSGAPGSGIRDSRVDYYIPHRDKEGYGLQTATIPKLKERGTSVIITVDCGIACVDEIRSAKEGEMDTIVVDHHQFGETLPDGHLIHPGLPGETYPFKSLAAVGVAYKFATALIEEARRRNLEIPEGWEKWLLDLVAIATVTDMVPLVGENRVLETYGLKVLNKARRPGLRALIDQAGLEPGSITAEDIAFGIGPRINAAGRMQHAALALELLLAESADDSRRLAEDLERCNRDRQEAMRRMMREADDKMSDVRPQGSALPKVIVIWNRDWAPALVGLVAGRFADRYHRPVLVVGQHDPQWIGSGRSIPGYDITAAVKIAGEGILTRSGGHPQACGFALQDPMKLHEFRTRLIEHATQNLTDEQLIPELAIDAELPLIGVTMQTAEAIDQLEPFGIGNARPVFLARAVTIASADLMGSERNHLRMQLRDETGRSVKVVGFKQGERILEIKPGACIDLVYTISINEWNGRRSAECRLVDFRASNPQGGS